MKKPNLTADCSRRVRATLVALLLAGLTTTLLVGFAQAAPPAPLPAAQGREASPQSPVRQALQETPILQPGAAKTQSKSGAGKSDNFGKTPIRTGASDSLSTASPSAGGSSFVAVMASLVVVIGLLFLVLWMMRRAMPGGASRKLPVEVLDVLGHASLGNRQQAQLVRLGAKLLLINVTATGAETLTEVTEPDEVERLTNLARQPAAASPAASFRQILQSFERKHAALAGPVKRPASAVNVPSAGSERVRG